MTKSASTKGFIGRVLDKLTGGDEAKVSRFQAKTVKALKGQVTVRKNEIEDSKERINDLNEKYEETLLDVNLEAIKTSDGLDEYVQDYINGLQAVKYQIEAVEAEIADMEAEIAKFEALIADLA